MITDLNVIVKEWAYRVRDGKPDPNNSAHLYHLSEILIENKWPLSVIDVLLQNLNEDDEWWTKLSPEQQAQYIKDHPKSQKAQDAKEKEQGEEPDTKLSTKDDKDYLKDFGIDTKGLSDVDIQSIVQTEKVRRKFLSDTIDILITQITQKRGAGAYNVEKEDLHALKKFAEGKGPKIENYEVTQDDVDIAYEMIEDKVKDIEGVSLGKIRSMLQNKGAADPDSVKVGTPEEPGPGFGRRNKVLESFLNCGGRSAVTGKPVSIGGSNVDHRLSLGLGGKDEPGNWIWMETNLNMMKSHLSDEDLIKRVNKELAKTPEDEKKKKLKQIVTKLTKEAYKKHYKEVFSKGGNGGFTEDDIRGMTEFQIKNIVRGWNAVHPKTSDFYVQTYQTQKGGSRAGTTGVGGRGVKYKKGDLIVSFLTQLNKKQPVVSSKEIKMMDEVLRKQIEKIEASK